ncbi:hypothetical protein ACWGEU_08195 [Streptomyces goshikiensis]
MAGRDLRALFSTNDRAVATAEAFTNRQAQWELVAAALAEHLRHVADPGIDIEDLERPRNNVIVFHGVGGIGKTTLSRKLEAALAGADQRPAQWGEPAWSGEGILPVRIDLSARPAPRSRTWCSPSAPRSPTWAARCPPSTSRCAATGRPSTPARAWRST